MQSFFERTIIICKIKNIPAQRDNALCYVPEIVCIQASANAFLAREINSKLRKKIELLKKYQDQFGIGVLPLKSLEARKLVEDLFNDILSNHFPLPVNSLQNELPSKVKNYPYYAHHIFVQEYKIKLARNKFTFFAKYLPLAGIIVTFTLTIGLTYSTLVTIFGWGWSAPLLCLFGLCKLISSYADISGGPERRLQTLGFWIDRYLSKIYTDYGKFSAPRLYLNLLVITILGCSSLLTWYSAWQLIRCIAGISDLPISVSSFIAGIFACSSAGATFGRIYSDLYQLLYRNLSTYFNFDNVKETEKININSLSNKLQSFTLNTANQNIERMSILQPSILTQYQQQLSNSSKNSEPSYSLLPSISENKLGIPKL